MIPLGGFVKITGMNPNEEVPPEAVDRAYYKQPAWKRIVEFTHRHSAAKIGIQLAHAGRKASMRLP